MNDLTRRDVLTGGLPLALALLHPALPTEEPKETPDRIQVRWYDNYKFKGHHLFAVGVACNPVSTTQGTFSGLLFRAGQHWTFRIGGEFHDIQAATLAEAKKLAEQQFVQTLRRCLVETERVVFALEGNR